jgi:ABC-type ATPase involved in cell division
MAKIQFVNKSPVFKTFRAESIRSMFNVTSDQGSRHEVNVDCPIDDQDWKIGVIVGPSGSGKTSIGKRLWSGGALHEGFEWSEDKPLIDDLAPGADLSKVTGALSSVGLGTVPSWLRPYHVLSMGEKFRADMARILLTSPEKIIIDEFTSVVDRQIAQIGALAFSKAWKRKKGQCILLSCHYDILDWVEPDWVLDTKYWEFQRGGLWRRPEVKLDIYEAGGAWAWKFFENHHYLKLPLPVAATYYVAEVSGEPVAHVAVCPRPGLKASRMTRLVVMPEWQGAGVGMQFLNEIAEMWLTGQNRFRKSMNGFMHTSHPGLVIALSRSPLWRLASQQMGGADRVKSRASIAKSVGYGGGGYGGHFRAVAGFKYVGGAA